VFLDRLKSEYLELGSEKAVGGWPLDVGKNAVNIELRATAFRHKGTKVHEVIADKS
jgi:hypothetical protein